MPAFPWKIVAGACPLMDGLDSAIKCEYHNNYSNVHVPDAPTRRECREVVRSGCGLGAGAFLTDNRPQVSAPAHWHGVYVGSLRLACCCSSCSRLIKSKNHVIGHSIGSTHSRVDELSKKNKMTKEKGGTRVLPVYQS